MLLPARVSGEAYKPLVADSLRLDHTLGELAQAGVEISAKGERPDTERAMLVELKAQEGPSEFRVGLQNFHVISSYNRSGYYASAVADLAQALGVGQGKAAQRAGK